MLGAAAIVLIAAGTAGAVPFTPGSAGLGDPFFPNAGNAGYNFSWAAENRYGNATTPQFIALSEQVSGMQLDNFFDVWLYRPEKPTSW